MDYNITLSPYITNKPTPHPLNDPTSNPTSNPTDTEVSNWGWSFVVLILPAVAIACITKPDIAKKWIINIKTCCSRTSENNNSDASSV